MRSALFLGAGAMAALVIGALVLVVTLGSLGQRTPQVPPAPTTTVALGQFGLYTPPPTPEPTPTPTPAPTRAPTPVATGEPVVEVGTQVGQRAPTLRLPHLAGGMIDSSTFEGGPLWINFMATWCPPCRDELPMMQGFQLQLPDEVEIILVDVAEDPDTVLNFMVTLQVDLPVALDEDGAAQREWEALALPVHFFIDADGIVQEVVFGGAPREIYVEALEQIVPGAQLDR